MSAVGAITILLLAAGSNPVSQIRPVLPKDDLPERLPIDAPRGLLSTEETTDAPAALRPHALRLGRRLFFDPILSQDNSVSCATCHQPAHGFASPEPIPAGIHGRRKGRNAPALLNRALGNAFSWDGRAATLTEQVLLPIEDPDEMGLVLAEALARVRDSAEYAPLVREAFGERFGRAELAEALAGFVSTLWMGDSPIDRFRGGDVRALSDAERHGLWLYESKAGCWRCHVGSNFTDEDFHDTGIGAKEGEPEPGRSARTGDPADRGRFKTPTLRGLAVSAPYMHDGSLATLEEVLAFYRKGGNANANLDPSIRPLELSDEEVQHLVDFLKALSRTAPVEGESAAGR